MNLRIAKKIMKREDAYNMATAKWRKQGYEALSRKERRTKLINTNHQWRKAMVVAERMERQRKKC